MAEFCLDCWNKLNHTHLTEKDVTLSDEYEYCEGCMEMKTTVVFLTPPRRSKARRGGRRGTGRYTAR